jgi:endonuclease YncB( thermonuclease family)
MPRTVHALSSLTLLIGLASAVPACASESKGRVVGVTDGYTITVLRNRTPVKVRLHGIDCPESRQDFGSRAKQATSELAFGKEVAVRPVDTDRYGRTVAEVVLPDGRVLSHELVKAGLAWWYARYAPKDSTLRRLEAEARAARRGIWSQPDPSPPWAWRRGDVPARQGGGGGGNRRSLVYQRPTCPGASRMAPGNRVVFPDEAAAAAAGYRSGKDCFR